LKKSLTTPSRFQNGQQQLLQAPHGDACRLAHRSHYRASSLPPPGPFCGDRTRSRNGNLGRLNRIENAECDDTEHQHSKGTAKTSGSATAEEARGFFFLASCRRKTLGVLRRHFPETSMLMLPTSLGGEKAPTSDRENQRSWPQTKACPAGRAASSRQAELGGRPHRPKASLFDTSKYRPI